MSYELLFLISLEVCAMGACPVVCVRAPIAALLLQVVAQERAE